MFTSPFATQVYLPSFRAICADGNMEIGLVEEYARPWLFRLLLLLCRASSYFAIPSRSLYCKIPKQRGEHCNLTFFRISRQNE